jgi:spore germination protein YaaH
MICLPPIVQRCGAYSREDKGVGIVKTAKAHRRQVWAWLRMNQVGGTYGVPTSEAAYLTNLDRIDAALPLNGGKLQADGTWLQEGWKIDPQWPQSLPGIARDAGHLYMPGVSNDRAGILTVLDDPGLQAKAADNLVALATAARFDSPWDGVYLDLEGIPSSYKQQLSDFLYLLSNEIKQAGLLAGVSCGGRTGDTGPDPDDTYTYDFSVVGEIADYIDLRCYGYWNPPPRSIGPYWWIEACIQYALQKGIAPEKMTLGLGNFSKYWPDSTKGAAVEIPYDLAVQLVEGAGSTMEWIERNEHGLVRERFAIVGAGHVWIHDGATHRHGLNLVDQYCLLGTTLFTPGMGDDLHWQVIEAWRTHRVHLPIVQKHSSRGR